MASLTPLGGQIVGKPVIVYRKSLKTTDLLFKGPDNFVYYKLKRDDEGWRPNEKDTLRKFDNVQIVGDITAVARNHQISVFGLDNRGRVHHLTWDGEHGYKDASWAQLSGDGFTGTVAATAWSDETLHIAARRFDRNIVSTRLITDDTDHDVWRDLDGVAAAGSPSIISATSEWVVVTTRDVKHAQHAIALYQGKPSPATWHPFNQSILFADVALAANYDNNDSRVHTFHLGTGGSVWGFRWQDEKWHNSGAFGGELASPPVAIERTDKDDDRPSPDDTKRITLYGLNRANKVVGLSFWSKTPEKNTGWKVLPKQSEATWASPPVPHKNGHLYLRGTNGQVFQYYPGDH